MPSEVGTSSISDLIGSKLAGVDSYLEAKIREYGNNPANMGKFEPVDPIVVEDSKATVDAIAVEGSSGGLAE